jgi:hypothetical protein
MAQLTPLACTTVEANTATSLLAEYSLQSSILRRCSAHHTAVHADAVCQSRGACTRCPNPFTMQPLSAQSMSMLDLFTTNHMQCQDGYQS